MAIQQSQKLELLKQIRDKQQALESLKETDPNMKMVYDTDVLDKVVDYMIEQRHKKEELLKAKAETTKINIIKNSIFEKQIFHMSADVIDYGFIPLMGPHRTNFDTMCIAFASNDESTNTGFVNITDMRGTVLFQQSFENCLIEHIVPALHPSDLHLAVLCSNSLDLHLLKFSSDPKIGVDRGSSKVPYFYLTGTNKINLPEKLRDLQTANFTDTELIIEKSISYMIKGNKYFLFFDQKGRVITVRGDLKVKNIFQLETPSITSVKRHNLALLFSTENNIGFLKIFEEISDQVFCEGGTSKIESVSGDYLTPNNIFATTKDTDGVSNLVIFEMKQTPNKIGAEECKIFGKIKLQNSASNQYSMTTMRGFVMTMDKDGTIEVFKALSVNDLVNDPISYVYYPFKKLSSGSEITSNVTQVKNSHLREIRSHQGTYVLMRNPQNLKQLILTEYIKISDKEESNWTEGYSFKILLFIIATV